MSKKLRCSFVRSCIHIYIYMRIQKKGAYRSCYNNQSVDNVRFVEQDHCFSTTEKFFEEEKKIFLVCLKE